MFRTKRLDEMMKYICAHEIMSTHYEVKKFLSLEKLRNRNEFDPSQDPEIESGSSGSATQGAGQWSSWKNSNMSPSDFNYIMKIGKERLLYRPHSVFHRYQTRGTSFGPLKPLKEASST